MSEREAFPPTAEMLLGQAHVDFLSRSVTTDGNEPYSIYHACEQVFINNKLDPVKMLPELIRFSSLLPKDIIEIITPLSAKTTWSDFAMELSYIILGSEIRRRFPDAVKEENRRLDNF